MPKLFDLITPGTKILNRDREDRDTILVRMVNFLDQGSGLYRNNRLLSRVSATSVNFLYYDYDMDEGAYTRPPNENTMLQGNNMPYVEYERWASGCYSFENE